MNLDLDKSTWKHVAFSDVVKNVNVSVKDPAAAKIERIIAMEHLDPGELKIRRWGSPEDGTTFTRRVRPGQTLFGKRRAYQRKVAYAEFDAICSGDILVFEADAEQMTPEFLPFLVQSNSFYNHALGTSAGSLSPRTNWRDLSGFEFGLPPLDDQQRLADLLWSVENACDANSAVLTRLRDTRRAYLNEFVRRTTTRAAVRDLAHPDWQPAQVGPFGGSLSTRHYKDSGVRVLKIQNITATHQIDLGYAVFVASEHAKRLERYWVTEDDTVIVAQGATVGKSAFINAQAQGSVISQHLIRVRLDPAQVLPRFVSLMIQSDDFQSQIDTVRTKSTRDGLNTDDVARFEIPRPSISEQAELVSCVRRIDEASQIRESENNRLRALSISVSAAIFGSA